MKGTMLAAGLLAVMAIGQSADAKSLEDILKEKGVITEADYKEVQKSKPAYSYTLGKGFTFTSADEKFQLNLGGRMQYRYSFMDYETAGDTSAFNAQRIRLVTQGYAYTKNLTYKLEIDPRAYATDTRLGLLDSYVNYKFMDELQLLIGQTKVKFGYSSIQSDGALMFVDRAPFIGTLSGGYEIGAFVYGKAFNGLVEYATSITNGDGQTAAASTNHNAFAARVAVSPLGAMANDEPDLAISKKPQFTIGANYIHNTVDAAGYTGYETLAGDLGEVNNFGVDAHFKWLGASLQGEAIFFDADKANGTDRRALGWYAQAGYMVTPKIGLALRYSQYDPNRDASNDLQTEQIGAVSYYFDKHNLKLQADVANIHKQTSSGPTDDLQFRVQAQLVF